MEKLSVPSFDEITPSNIVGIFELDDNIDINPIFRLCKIDTDILGMSFQFFERGNIIKKKKYKKCKKCWRNGICIKMKDSASFKLSKNTLQVSGVKSIEKAFGCFNILSQHFSEVDMMLKKIHEDIDSSER